MGIVSSRLPRKVGYTYIRDDGIQRGGCRTTQAHRSDTWATSDFGLVFDPLKTRDAVRGKK